MMNEMPMVVAVIRRSPIVRTMAPPFRQSSVSLYREVLPLRVTFTSKRISSASEHHSRPLIRFLIASNPSSHAKNPVGRASPRTSPTARRARRRARPYVRRHRRFHPRHHNGTVHELAEAVTPNPVSGYPAPRSDYREVPLSPIACQRGEMAYSTPTAA